MREHGSTRVGTEEGSSRQATDPIPLAALLPAQRRLVLALLEAAKHSARKKEAVASSEMTAAAVSEVRHAIATPTA